MGARRRPVRRGRGAAPSARVRGSTPHEQWNTPQLHRRRLRRGARRHGDRTSIDPATEEVYGVSPVATRGRPRSRVPRGIRRVRDLGRDDARRATARPLPHRGRDGVARRGVRRPRVAGHRQAPRHARRRRDHAVGRPAPLLRRRRAQPRGALGGRVPRRPHVVRPPRADRRHRPGHAVELPAQHGGLEGRAGDRRRQHRGAQALGHDAPRRPSCSPRWRPSSCPPACSTWSRATAAPARRSSSTRPRRWSPSPARCARGWRSRGRRHPT